MVKLTKKDDASEVELEGEISTEAFESKRKGVMKKFSESVKIDGFRPGHVPEKVLLEHVGEMAILEEMAEEALRDAYPNLLIEHELEAIGKPQISVTKIAAGNPLGFRITQAVMPEIKLPDYKSIAGKITKEPLAEVVVADEEIAKVLEDLVKQRAPEGLPAQAEGTMPAIDDEFAKSLGDFENLDALKNQIRGNIKHEKEHEQASRRRVAILDAILADTNFAIPNILVDRELENMFASLKNDLARVGVQWDDYLKHIKKPESEIKEGMRKDADRKARIGLVLRAIAATEKIEIPAEELDLETAKVLDYYQGADPESARHYVEGVLKDEQVLKLLEKAEELTN